MSKDYVNTAVKEALDIFMLPHCNKKFPQDIRKSARPCLNYHINLCSGACAGKISEAEHNRNCDEALRFILGEKNEIIRELRDEMEKASENLEFERAAELRDRIAKLKKEG
jgi:excinuclease ABC subunit C